MIRESIKAVIFDLDGLIVDTEEIGVTVAAGIFKKRFNIELTAAERKSFYGIPDLDFNKKIVETRGLRVSPEEILEEHNEKYNAEIEKVQETLPGVEKTLQQAKQKGLKIGLCSGSYLNQIQLLLTNLNILSYFDAIISCEDTSKHKPDSEPYLIIARKLNVAPASCLVFEDAETGVKAAKKAGMKCVGVMIGNHGTQDLKEADIVIETLEEFSFDRV